jgi:hypothetical protein
MPGAGGERWLKQKELIAGRVVNRSTDPPDEGNVGGGGGGFHQNRPGQAGFNGNMVGAAVANQMAGLYNNGSGNNNNANAAAWMNNRSLPPQLQTPPVPLQKHMNNPYASLAVGGVGMTASSVAPPVVTPALGSPVDIQSLIVRKGWNPTQFDTEPKSARCAPKFSLISSSKLIRVPDGVFPLLAFSLSSLLPKT